MTFRAAAAADTDGPLMFMNDSLAHPEAQSGPFDVFGGEERFENSSNILGLDARPVIGNGNAKTVSAVLSNGLTHANGECSRCCNRFEPIHNQVGEALAQFPCKPVQLLAAPTSSPHPPLLSPNPPPPP